MGGPGFDRSRPPHAESSSGWECCCTCATPTPSKPPGPPQWTGDELRQVRLGAADARLAAIRATAEADTARRQGQHDKARQQQALATSYQAMHDAYADREAVFAVVMADRHQWEKATRQQRQLAVAADAELRRRHPRPAVPAAALGRTRARHARTTRRAHPDRGGGHPAARPVDPRPIRRAPRLRRPAGPAGEPGDPRRRPRLRRPRVGLPRLDRRGQGRDPPAAQAADPAVAADPGKRHGP